MNYGLWPLIASVSNHHQISTGVDGRGAFFVLPMLLPGITISTSPTDFAPVKQMQLEKFDGNTWKLFGNVISASGTAGAE